MITFEPILYRETILNKLFEVTDDSKFLDQVMAFVPEAKKDLQTIDQHTKTGGKEAKCANWYSPETSRPIKDFILIKCWTPWNLTLKTK